MKATGPEILFCSDFPLGYFNPEAEERISRLTRRGYRVVYVDKLGVRNPRPAALVRRLAGGATAGAGSSAGPRPELNYLSPKLLLPRRVPLIHTLNGHWLARQLRASLAGPPEEAIAWARFPTPELLRFLEREPHRLVVYEVVDEHAEGPGVTARLRRVIEATEHRMLARAEVVFASSRPVFDRLAAVHPRVVLAPAAAVDVEPFSAAGAAAAPAQRLAVYAGALDFRFDARLVREVAQLLPDWHFHLAGPAEPEVEAELAGLPNLRMTGRFVPAQLPGMLAQAAVCLMPYRRNRFTDTLFPVKLVQYLAAGRPVVSTAIRAVEDFRHIVAVVDGPEAVAAAVVRAFAEDAEEARAARLAEARRHSWDARVDQFDRALREALGGASGVDRPP